MHNIKLDAYTCENASYTNPICELRKHLPEWWKELSSTATTSQNFTTKTMKSCNGFVDYHASALTIPMWTDIVFDIGESIEDGISCNYDSLQVHPFEQRGGYLPAEKYQHVKLIVPWIIECKEDIKFAFVANIWALENPEYVIIPPGVIDFKSQHSAHLNMFFPYDGRKKQFVIKTGTPIINLIPLTDRKCDIEIHPISEYEFIEKNNSHIPSEKSKCPFHKS